MRLKNENRKKARYGESEANKKSQSEGVDTNALQTMQWEARDLTNPKAPKEGSQSNSNKNGGSNNNDEEDDDDDDDDDDYCEEDYEMDENERARADVEISRQSKSISLMRMSKLLLIISSRQKAKAPRKDLIYPTTKARNLQ